MSLDCSAVLIGYLLGQSSITAVVSTAVHNKRLPDGVEPPCIIVEMLGNGTNVNFPEIEVKKFGITCYGSPSAPNQERTLFELVADALRNIAYTTAYSGGKLCRALQDDSEGGETEGVDENNGWLFVASQWEIYFRATS